MKFKSKLQQEGFTLIELLVVIAIISLLSSVVLASLKEVREKAEISKFKQELSQFIIALELYKADNGRYPGEPASYFLYNNYRDSSGGFYSSSVPLDLTLPSKLSEYIGKIPNAPKQDAMFWYYKNNDNLRCQGDTKPSSYYILVQNTQPGFEKWPIYTWAGIPYSSFRCFSIK